jgi:hypothetical protein
MIRRKCGPEGNCMGLPDVDIGVSRVIGFCEMINLW